MRERRQPEIIAGRVNTDGTIAAGDSFSSRRTGVGTYTLDFPSTFRLVALPITMTSSTVIGSTSVSGSSATVTIVIAATGAAIDAAFSFVAAGVQQ